MSNNLVGDVFAKIIEVVVENSRTTFEEFGVTTGTLQELQEEWQRKLSARGTASMPWDPKPVQAPQSSAPPPAAPSNGMTPASFTSYDTPPSAAATNAPRVKQEPVPENYGGLPNGYPPGVQPQGGAARAAQLIQQQYGQAASASVNAMQRGLALPGQQQAKPPPTNQQQYSAQQQQALRQQQQLQQQQAQPRIKVENESPHLSQGAFPPQTAQSNYGQTDGADDPLQSWQTMLAERRALHAEHGQEADRMMRAQVMQKSIELQSGLMMPLDDLPSNKRLKRTVVSSTPAATSSASSIPQLDGLADDEDEEKPDIKDEDDDADAINSDLDDSSEDDRGALGDEDDENIDSVLCTYDKVQRVKNKWKCTLKDGIMAVNGKEWVFAKGMGEFEW